MNYSQLEMITIDRRSTVDYDLQLKESIKSLILDQSFYYHTVMPSIGDLSKHLSIDIEIVESAYNQLVVDGFLKLKDRSYYVSFFELTNYFFDKNVAVYDAIKALGLEPSIECLVKKVIKLDKEETESKGFEYKEGNQFLYLNRIYKGDNQPIMIMENYLPLSVFPELHKKLTGTEPLSAFIKKEYGIIDDRSIRTIKSVNLSSKLSTYLKERKNAASIQSTNRVYDKLGRLLDYSQSHSAGSYYFQSLVTKEEIDIQFDKLLNEKTVD